MRDELSVSELISIQENVEKVGQGSIVLSRVKVLLDSVLQQQDKKVKEKLGLKDPNFGRENLK